MMGVSTLDKKDQNRDYDHQDSLDESTQVRYLCTLSYCFKVCGNINIATRYWNEQFKCLFEKAQVRVLQSHQYLIKSYMK